jgi:hypothetical protein
MALQPIFDGIQWMIGLSLGGVKPGSGSSRILNAGQKLDYLNQCICRHPGQQMVCTGKFELRNKG